MSSLEDKLTKKSKQMNEEETKGALDGIEEINNNDYGVENTLRKIKKLSDKRKVKNVTYGLYADQQESIKEIVEKLGISANDFMRENVDLIIKIAKENLDI